MRSSKQFVAKLEEMGAELLGEGSRTIHAHWYAGESRCNNGTHRTNAGRLIPIVLLRAMYDILFRRNQPYGSFHIDNLA